MPWKMDCMGVLGLLVAPAVLLVFAEEGKLSPSAQFVKMLWQHGMAF